MPVKTTLKKEKGKHPELKIAKPKEKSDKYFESVGRRKTSIARVRVFERGEKGIFVNDKPLEKYFTTLDLQEIVTSPLQRISSLGNFRVLVKVTGGGYHSQAEAVKHGISRALAGASSDFSERLRSLGFLTRDSRMKERKKFGLKRARRAPQWQKR